MTAGKSRMSVTITAIKDPGLRSLGYTHEYLVTNWTGYAVRNGITKGMNFNKFRQILRGEKVSK